MISWDNLGKKKKYILIIMTILLILVLIFYAIIIYKNIRENTYINQLMEISEKNETPDFSIEKIYLCSSANAIYNVEENNEKDLDIYQYTDIAIYLNNYQEEVGISNQNTVKELYIDNIELSLNSNLGNASLGYTNLLKIGSKEIVPNFTQNEKIDFQIIYTNNENESANYENPTFYTDCSNPITLRYVNDLDTDYFIQEGATSSFDGSILKDAGVSIEDINCKIKFKINLVNNEGNYYSCWLSFSLPLSDIYNGTTIKTTTVSGAKYNFFAA